MNRLLLTTSLLLKFLLLLIPSLIFIEISFIGIIYLPEIILLLISFVVLPRYLPQCLKGNVSIFIALALIFLSAQVFSDIYNNSLFQNYSRGWANIIFFIINFLSLYVILNNKPINFIFFGFGLCLGLLLSYFFSPNIYAQAGNYWKFGIGFPITFLLIIITNTFFNKFFCYFVLVFLTILNFYLGFRSLGGICFISFIFLFISNNKFIKNVRFGMIKTMFTLFFIIFFIILIYSFLASNNFFGDTAQQLFKQQSGPFSLLIGGRQEIVESLYVIYNMSPFVGYGSWPTAPYDSSMMRRELLDYWGYYDTPVTTYQGDMLIPHSHLFSAYIYSGFFGSLLWLWLILMSLKSLIKLLSNNIKYKGVYFFIIFLFLWKIFFSNFFGSARFIDGYLICTIFLIFNLDRKILGKLKC